MNRAEANRIARRDKKYKRRQTSDNSAQKLALIKKRKLEIAIYARRT